jgi:predicted amidohydrolase YtcJ
MAYAESILQHGNIWTGAKGPRASAIAVADGRILGLGELHDLDGLRTSTTRIVDLGGQSVLPGFIDAHAHVWKIGHLLTTLLDLRPVDSLASLADRLRGRARRLPPGGWLQGRGYNEARFAEGRGPTRADLDAIVSDRPVVIMRTCAHIVVCNTKALEQAGIDGNTPAPAGGEIDRDAEGRANGVLRETAMGLVLRQAPPPTTDEYAAMITAALHHQLTCGITSTTDAGVSPELLAVYHQLDVDERLAARVNVMALAMIDGVGRVPAPAERHVTDRLRIDTVKCFADGGLSGATAALSVPYRHADTRGVLRVTADELYDITRGPHEAGWRIATHAIGDEAIEHVLQAYEQLGPGPVRHRIEHFGLPTPEQMARASRLGVIAAPQTVFVHELGRNFRRYLPDTLLARVYPVRGMLDAGITVALSSDAPVVENDAPLVGMRAAVLRRDSEGAEVAPGEAISIDDAIDGYTRGGALACGADHEVGSLRAGMHADLVVLSGDIRRTPPEELASVRVTQTWVDGQLVFEA